MMNELLLPPSFAFLYFVVPVLWVLLMSVAVFTLVAEADLARAPRVTWTIVVVAIPFIGAIAWLSVLLARRAERRVASRSEG
jgi:hypothetical protein